MVQSCCNNCYEKYISKNDGESIIDEKFITDQFGKKYEIIVEEEEIEDELKRWLLDKGHKLPTTTYILSKDIKTKLCMCTCHVHGIQVIH